MEEVKETEVVLEPVAEKKSKILGAVKKYWKKGAIVVAILAAAAGTVVYLTQPEAGDSSNGDTV